MSPGPHKVHCLYTIFTSLSVERPPCCWPQRAQVHRSSIPHGECATSVPSSVQCATATSLYQASGDRHSETHSLYFRGEETPGLSRGSQPASSPEKHLALGEFRCQNPALTGRQLQNHLRRTRHTSKRAGEASGKGRLLLQSSKQKFLETKPKILSHQVFLNGSKQFSERPDNTLTQGLPDSRAATVASSQSGTGHSPKQWRS